LPAARNHKPRNSSLQYAKGLETLENFEEDAEYSALAEDEQQEVYALRLAFFLNLAAAGLDLESWDTVRPLRSVHAPASPNLPGTVTNHWNQELTEQPTACACFQTPCFQHTHRR
jgi:hypothetical protein